jgi:hypothetical protein
MCPRTCAAEQFIRDNPDVQAIHTVVPNGAQLACWNVWVSNTLITVHTIKLPDEQYVEEQQAAVNTAVHVAAVAGMHDLTVSKAVPQFERYGLSV